MPLHDRSIPLSSEDDQSDLLDQKLVLICKNLLERPSGRRGPFYISDSELRSRTQTPNSGLLRL